MASKENPNKNKHLTPENRQEIEECLTNTNLILDIDKRDKM